ncbi:DUF6538 domain-containing protein, partial [Salipiger sp. PrR002]|uniref:DUF6538 domain-containing protein n=1 Tax=Salipiger sp. PrR002 TaxID=2706489 RepID=UPI0013BAACCD
MDIISDIIVVSNYPAAKLVQVKGKWYTQVTIPSDLRPAFNGRKQERRGTGDRGEAERRMHDKAAEIYAAFDKAQKSFDPVAHAAGELLKELPGRPKWPDTAWQDDEADQSANELRGLAGSVLHMATDPRFVDAEEGHAIAASQDRVEALLWAFEQELAKRRESKSACGKRFSEVANQCLNAIEYNRKKTEGSYRKAAQKFTDFANDPDIAQVTGQTALEFVEHLASKHAYNTLQRDIGTVRRVFVFAQDQAWIDANPFADISLKGKGSKAIKRQPLRRSQLEALFTLEMSGEDRLALSILAATGMRLDEVALLEWQDIKNEGGIEYFDLQRIGKIIKNSSSARLVPVPSCIELPPRANGRLFTYALGLDGKACAATPLVKQRDIAGGDFG